MTRKYAFLFACAAASLVAVPAARAETIVSFTTAGQFGFGTMTESLKSITTSGGDSILRVGPWGGRGGTFVKYEHTTQAIDRTDFVKGTAWTNFGKLLFGSEDDPNRIPSKEKWRDYNGATFTLAITQMLPVVSDNTNSFQTQKVKGSLQYVAGTPGSGNNLTDGFMHIVFANPLAFTLPGSGGPNAVTYALLEEIRINGAGQLSAGFTIPGSVTTAVPLPGTAVLGVTLLAGLAAVRGIFSRRPVVHPGL